MRLLRTLGLASRRCSSCASTRVGQGSEVPHQSCGPRICAIDAFGQFDRRQAGWIKVELKVAA
jgi:hypothetical protein